MRCFLRSIERERARRDQSTLVLLRAAQADTALFTKLLRGLEEAEREED